eukprot:3536571-Pyramimonas_sp.AAC.1
MTTTDITITVIPPPPPTSRCVRMRGTDEGRRRERSEMASKRKNTHVECTPEGRHTRMSLGAAGEGTEWRGEQKRQKRIE